MAQSYIKGSNVLITGGSSGIGLAIASVLAARGAAVGLFSRRETKLKEAVTSLRLEHPQTRFFHRAVDIQDPDAVQDGVRTMAGDMGGIDILINNPFSKLTSSEIVQVNNTNINGTMLVTHAVLNSCFMPRKDGTILTISSSTGLEVPTSQGKVSYHVSKAAQEAFSNALRNELVGTDIRVLVVRPGFVDTEFHTKATGAVTDVHADEDVKNSLFRGYVPLQARDVADSVAWMLEQPVGVSVKSLDVVPTAQRSIAVFDRGWNERHS